MSASILHFGEKANNFNVFPLKWSSVRECEALWWLSNHLVVPSCQGGLSVLHFYFFIPSDILFNLYQGKTGELEY